MKHLYKNCLSIATVALLGSFAATTQAQVVFSDNFEGYTAGTSELAGWASTGTLANYSLTVAAGTGVGGSQGLTWQADFNAAYSGYMPCNLGYSGGNPSGNTDANINDYTLSFDMAIASGVALNHLQLTLQGWEGQWFSGAMNGGTVTIDTSAVGVGTGFQHFNLNLGTLAAGTGFDPLDQTYQFQWQLNGWELAGGGPVTGEQLTLDNVQISIVPEPSTIALVGLGMAGLCWLRRRNA